MAQINNLPQHIRNGKGLGSTQVVGWLPIVSIFSNVVPCQWLFTASGFWGGN